MPGYPDKIIINHGGGRGTAALIEEDFKVLEALAAELISHGMYETDLRDKLKAACDAHYKSDMEYHDRLRELIAETARRIDAQVCP